MKNRLKKINAYIVCTIVLLAFVLVGAKSSVFAAQAPTAQAPVTQSALVKDKVNPTKVDDSNKQGIPEKNAYALTHMEKNGVQYAIFKFLIAMLCVIVSAGMIFFGLKLYQKFVLKNNGKFDSIDYDKMLESPKDFKEAINIFLEKTDK